MKLLLLGFGNVGRRVVEILADPASYPRLEDLGDFRVVGIVTRSHGATLDPRGLDLQRVLEEWRREGRFRGNTSLCPVWPRSPISCSLIPQEESECVHEWSVFAVL